MKTSAITDPLFREAVASIDSGNLALLQQLLEANPHLAYKRLEFPTEGYFKHPYLLWFIADNPVRVEKLPANMPEITQLLIQYAQHNAGDSFQYQVDYTLGLVVTGRVPRESGVQIAMMDALIDAGAIPGNGHGALAHGNIDAARHLIVRGGKLTLASAVCFNDVEQVSLMLKTANQEDKQAALMAAAIYGNDAMISLLIKAGAEVNNTNAGGFHAHASPLHQAVSSGSLRAVKVLVASGANLEAEDSIYHGTPLGWAKHMQTEQDSLVAKEKYAAIEAFLLTK